MLAGDRAAAEVETQAVFSLRGKPKNCFGVSKKIVYENEEFNLLQHALNIEDDIENLNYSRVVLATDADVDGSHIRLLLLTFFLQFFPELIREGHVYILQTPLFRVRNKKETFYCYTEEERLKAIKKCGKASEITRFKGLGEMMPKVLWETTLNPETRSMLRVEIDDHLDTDRVISDLMGRDASARFRFIMDRAEDAEEIDV